MSTTAERFRHLDESLARSYSPPLDLPGTRRTVGNVPLVRLDPAESQVRCLGHGGGQVDDVADLPEPTAPLPGVHLDQHVQLFSYLGEGTLEHAHAGPAIDQHRQPDAARQVNQPRHLLRPDHLVRDEDVVQPRSGHDLRLAELGDGDPRSARFYLEARDLRALVRLGVGAESNAETLRHLLHRPDVATKSRRIDEEGRCVQLHRVPRTSASVRSTCFRCRRSCPASRRTLNPTLSGPRSSCSPTRSQAGPSVRT